jgi:uncharacterized protein
MRHIGLALLAASSAALGVAHAELAEGYAAYQRQDFDRAVEEFLPLAGRADPVAAYYLGMMHFEGRGVTRDAAVGTQWLTRAAEGGHTGAQLRLAAAYQAGESVAQDYRAAARWMREAAYGGNADAQYFLGRFHRDGRGVVQDDREAYEWIHRSVEYGLSHDKVLEALLYLGAAHEWGRGVRQDLVEAYKWYSLAASHSMNDVRNFAEAGRAMDALRLRMNPAQIAEAGRRAQAWRDGKLEMYAAE